MDINNINYLTFEGGREKGTIYLSTTMLLILLLVCIISCNAQTPKQDSLTEEFKLIDVLIPETINGTSYNKMKANLTKHVINFTEKSHPESTTHLTVNYGPDKVDIKENNDTKYSYHSINVKDSLNHLHIDGYYYSKNKDSLNSIRIEISNKIKPSDKTYQDNDTYLTIFEYIKDLIIIKYINTLNLPIKIKDNTYMDFDDEIINSCFWGFKNDNGFININYNKKKNNTVWNKSITVEIDIPLY